MPAALIAAALLLCHGVFGYAHQLELTDTPAPPAGYADEADAHHPAHHDSSGEHPSGAYFATVLALLLGALLLPRPGRRAESGPAIPVLSGRRPPPSIFYPPRGPTPSSLQVFRL